MRAWKEAGYVIFGRPLAEVRAPALVAEVDLDEVYAGMAAAQADLEAAARDPKWRRMMEQERWLEEWLTVQLYVRLT